MDKLSRYMGPSMIVIGAVWLLLIVVGLSSYQHLLWIQASQELTIGDSISREEAVSAMRGLALNISDRVHMQVYPVLLLIIGSFLSILNSAKQKPENKSVK